MINIFNDLPLGEAEGFACVKVYNDQRDTIGYALRRLSTNEEMMFIYDKRFYDDSFENTIEYERFVFSLNLFSYVSNVIEKVMQDANIKSLFLDEIGRLELSGLGFSEILTEMMKSKKDLYLCINDRYIDAISSKYDIKNYHCI